MRKFSIEKLIHTNDSNIIESLFPLYHPFSRFLLLFPRALNQGPSTILLKHLNHLPVHHNFAIASCKLNGFIISSRKFLFAGKRFAKPIFDPPWGHVIPLYRLACESSVCCSYLAEKGESTKCWNKLGYAEAEIMWIVLHGIE